MTAHFDIFGNLKLQPGEPVVVAVSGGSDSLALLMLLHDFVRKADRDWKLHAVTVDHGLREASAAEAVAVGELCAAHGIAHRIVGWRGEKPASGIMAAAREARMSLLAEAARAVGSRLVLVGHTADDQAETVSMRDIRGEGRGSAGIAPASLFAQEIWFLRPLLHLRRQELRDYLTARAIAWIDDPSNANERYERVVTRNRLGSDDFATLLERQWRAARSREAENARLAAFLRAELNRDSTGRLCLPREEFSQLPDALAVLALRVLCAAAGGADHLPDMQRSADLLRRIGGGAGGSLARAVVSIRSGFLRFAREKRNLPVVPLDDVAPDQAFIWDGRFRVKLKKPVSGRLVAAGDALEPAVGEATGGVACGRSAGGAVVTPCAEFRSRSGGCYRQRDRCATAPALASAWP